MNPREGEKDQGNDKKFGQGEERESQNSVLVLFEIINSSCPIASVRVWLDFHQDQSLTSWA